MSQTVARDREAFVIDLCSFGECGPCCYSWLCSPCALAETRTKLDGSSCCFNFLCMNAVATRWMARTAYGIPGDECSDLAVAVCCIPCSTNQLYQTAKAYGNPSTDGGSNYNVGSWANMNNGNQCTSCMYATCCMPCSVGTALNKNVGMPFWMGCCCVNICSARNIIRYQSRIRGDECWEEIMTPCAIYLGCIAGYFCPILYCCIGPAIVAQSMQLQAQADAKPSRTNRYLEPVQAHTVVNEIAMSYTNTSEQRAPVAVIPPPGMYPVQQQPQIVYAYADPQQAQPAQVVYAMPGAAPGQQVQYAYAQATYAAAPVAGAPPAQVHYGEAPPPAYEAQPVPHATNDSINKDEYR